MKVLLIDVNCKGSSTGKIVYDLYRRLMQEGHEAAVCYGRGKVVREENIYKFGLEWETYIHAGLARVTGLNGCFSWFSTRRLIKYIDSFQPDVVHIHELHAYFVNLKCLFQYLKHKKIKIVYTFHCEYMYTGKCGHAYDCEKWKTECGKCPAVKEYPKSLFFDFTKKMFCYKKKLLADLDFTIVTPSKWLAERVKQSFLKDKNVVVIHNGIDAETVFYPRKKEEVAALKKRFGLSDKKIVLSVAPNIMSESKGGQTVLEVSKYFKGENIHFVLVGADSHEEISDNVTLVRKTTDQDELALWYSAADVFLICSKRENFPTTSLEAFCCGTPVVGIDAGGTRETVPWPFGTFVKAVTEDLQKEIRLQINSSCDSKLIAKQGRLLYDKTVMYSNYLCLYENSIIKED